MATTAPKPSVKALPKIHDRSTSHPFFPNLALRRSNNGTITFSPVLRRYLPSPDSRRDILSFLGYTDEVVEKILRVYDCGNARLRLEPWEMRRYPLASALLRVWEASHEWDDEGEGIDFAIRNGLREEYSRDIQWAGLGKRQAVVRYLEENVHLLKGLWLQDRWERMNRPQRNAVEP
jgi:hypothetical protein